MRENLQCDQYEVSQRFTVSARYRDIDKVGFLPEKASKRGDSGKPTGVAEEDLTCSLEPHNIFGTSWRNPSSQCRNTTHIKVNASDCWAHTIAQLRKSKNWDASISCTAVQANDGLECG